MSAPGGAAAPLVVVGGSLAGLRAAEAARSAGWGGRLVLVCGEPELPYDRPPLSKAALDPAEPAAPTTLRTRPELDGLGIEVRLGEPAQHLDLGARTVTVGAEELAWSRLVVATGAHARTLPGQAGLDGVHTLRTAGDSAAIRAGLERGGPVVVVGGGFVGAEVASAARARGLEVTVVEAATQPLVRAVGEQAAPMLAGLHRRHGTVLRCGVGVATFRGEGRVEAVVLDDGTVLAADLVVVGVGTVPATGWLTGSGLTLDDGVLCDPTLRTSHPDVWAAGDVARVTDPAGGASRRLEHWTAAAEQGAAAGRHAADPSSATPFSTVPYFWSDWYGTRLQMVGVAGGEMAVLGDPGGERWVVLHRSGDQLGGALTANLPGRVMKLRALVARGGSWDDAVALARAAVA